MQVVLNEKHPPTCMLIDMNTWQQSMYERIHKWYGALPHARSLPSLQRKSLEAFELTLHRALFYLYHPSLNIPKPSDSALLALMDAATHMIQLYQRFFRDYRLTIYWQAVENLYAAGNALLFTYVESAPVREKITLQALESLVRTCSSVLWGMVEHFPDFQGRRDAFALTASQVLEDINKSSVAVGCTPQSQLLSAQNTHERQHHHMNIDESAAHLRQKQQQSILELNEATTSGVSEFETFPNDEDLLPRTHTGHMTFSPPIYPHSDQDNEHLDWEGFDKLDDFLAPAWMQ